MPPIKVDLGKPENALYPVESTDNFNLRTMQRDQRARRVANGGN